MSLVIETERLILKPMCADDALNLFELNNDTQVTQYTGDTAFKDPEEATNFIKAYDKIYQTYLCGRLSTFLKSNGEYIGWCGLKYLTEKNATDLGYRWMRRHWNKGYATEAAKACINDGFNRLNLNEIIASAMLANIKSINVFKKLGLQYLSDADCGCQPGVIYAITRDEWRNLNEYYTT
jgi:ribosomal-protein-alanine N-acetyltransferase